MKTDRLKQRLLAAARAADAAGLCRPGSGNFSVLDRESGLMVITPSGSDRGSLHPEDLPVLNLAGRIVENPNQQKPSSEYRLHLTAYQTRPDIAAVAHTHSPYATAFAVTGTRIDPVLFEACIYGGTTGMVDYAIPGSAALAENIREPLAAADALLLKSHGTLTVAETIEGAVTKAIYLEDVAHIAFLSRQLSSEPSAAIPPEDFDAYRKMK